MTKEMSFEASLKALEEVVTTLEGDEVTLEDAIKKYKEGIALVERCNGAIDKIEKELEVIKDKEV